MRPVRIRGRRGDVVEVELDATGASCDDAHFISAETVDSHNRRHRVVAMLSTRALGKLAREIVGHMGGEIIPRSR